MVFVGKGTPFGGQEGIGFGEIRDGAASTIMLVEAGADKAVPWTKPEDLPFNPDDPAAEIGDLPSGRFWAVFFDGYTRTISKDTDTETLRLLIQHNDCQPLYLDRIR